MVTDTAMAYRQGKVYAFGPVVRELEVFQLLFEEIEWIGFNYPDRAYDPSMLPVPDPVRCVLLRRSGGDSLLKKVGVFVQAPFMLLQILRRVKGKSVIHTRAPSSPAFIAALLSFLLRHRVWWHKYAGNWGESSPPFGYRMQQWWLSKAYWSKVTINGVWPKQPAHCLSFDNPCLDPSDCRRGARALAGKSFAGPLVLCFVGHLNTAKGIDKLLAALPALPPERVKAVHLVGDGPFLEVCKALKEHLSFPLVLHGYCSRAKVGEIMAASHLLVLPSLSEGFPKVISEAANYGCIPVVSDISAIHQTIQQGVHGFLLKPERLATGYLAADLQAILDSPILAEVARSAHAIAKRFTFERYGERIRQEILKS